MFNPDPSVSAALPGWGVVIEGSLASDRSPLLSVHPVIQILGAADFNSSLQVWPADAADLDASIWFPSWAWN